MTLALRLLAYVSLFRVLGPLLVTVLAMVSDAARFSGVLLVVIVGWANGVCVCTTIYRCLPCVCVYIDAYAPIPPTPHMHMHPSTPCTPCTPRVHRNHAHSLHMTCAL